MKAVWINLPAIAEQDEYIDGKLFRREGDPLCPELRSLEYLHAAYKDVMPSYWWDAMMQGRPSQPEEFYFDWAWFTGLLTEELPPCYVGAVACDPATGKRRDQAKGDNTAMCYAGLNGDGHIYLDYFLDRIGFEKSIREMCSLGGRQTTFPMVFAVESNGFQGELGTQLFRYLKDEEITAHIMQIENTTKKNLRIISLEPYLSGGLFRMRDNDHAHIAIGQFKNFRLERNDNKDDAPDVTEMALKALAKACTIHGERASEEWAKVNRELQMA